MRESDRLWSRRQFLLTTAGLSATLIVGERVFEELEKLFPRRLVQGTVFPIDIDDLTRQRVLVRADSTTPHTNGKAYVEYLERELPSLAASLLRTREAMWAAMAPLPTKSS